MSTATVTTRILWTWDHCTAWVHNRPGGHDYGASNEYGRTPELFLADYTALLEWCGRHGIDGVVVWGLLRDVHGGAESVHRLCEVARRCGVRLLAGIGLNAYGGVYYEGDSPYSLVRHLARHPELCALRSPGGPPLVLGAGPATPQAIVHACPSRRENQEFTCESLAWLFRTFDLGGVQMESGDTGVCECELCRDRRQHPVSWLSWEDMALMYPLATAAIRGVRPDAMVLLETYSHPEPHRGPEPAPGFGGGLPAWGAECLAAFPPDTIVQWVGDSYLPPGNSRPWTAAGRPPPGPHRHLLRNHFGTYWHRYRHELAVDWLAAGAQAAVAHGFDGMSIFGEGSPRHAGNELNYLALADLGSGANPDANLDSFLARVAGPRLGGLELAREYLRLARYADRPGEIAAALPAVRRTAAALDGAPARRWSWLADFLAGLVYDPRAEE